MSLYTFALFLHILGALGLFIALGLESIGLWHLRRSGTLEDARHWLAIVLMPGPLYGISWAAIIIPGIYMAVAVWGEAAWIAVAFLSVCVIIILGVILSRKRMVAIGGSMEAEGGTLRLSPALRDRFRDPMLWTSLRVRLAIAVGIVFLMAVKPGLAGSLAAMGTAVVLGLVLGPSAGLRSFDNGERRTTDTESGAEGQESSRATTNGRVARSEHGPKHATRT